MSFVFTPTIFFVRLFHVPAALCSYHTSQADGSGMKNKGHYKVCAWGGGGEWRKGKGSRKLQVKAKSEIRAKLQCRSPC